MDTAPASREILTKNPNASAQINILVNIAINARTHTIRIQIAHILMAWSIQMNLEDNILREGDILKMQPIWK